MDYLKGYLLAIYLLLASPQLGAWAAWSGLALMAVLMVRLAWDTWRLLFR